jgi:hypothetical protein
MSSDGSVYSGKAIGIVGLHYCGSTVLSLVLGSHPAIHGGGELFYLFHMQEKKGRPFCHVCGNSCEFWTAAHIAEVQQGGLGRLYENVARIFGKPIVCDASKLLQHFRAVVNEDQRSETLFVVLTKHPIRHASSFLTHDLFGKHEIRTEAQVRQAWVERHDEIMEHAYQTLRRIQSIYGGIERWAAELAKRGSIIRMAYELLVEDPVRALQPVMEFAGVDFDPRMLDYISHEHHPIGMNTGLRMQLRKQRGLPDAAWDYTDYRRDYYGKAETLRMDNNYLKSFSPQQIDMLTHSPEVRELCERLRYDPDPEGTAPDIQPYRRTSESQTPLR